MDHEISAQKMGEKHRTLWLWFSPVTVLIILLIGSGYLSIINTRAEVQQVTQDLGITKSHQGNFLIGSTGVYSITVSNAGAGVVSDTITVTDILTGVLTPIGITGTGWDPCGYSGQTVTCVYSNTSGLGVGATLPVIRLNVDVNPAATTQIVNSASVTNVNDVNTGNNTALDPTNIVGSDLAVSKTLFPASPSAGSVITYTLTVSNQGPSQATGVVLTDTLPAGVTFQSSVPSQGTYTQASGRWDVGTLANGSAATLRLRASVNAGGTGQTIVNATQGLKSAVNDYNLANNTASVSFTVQTTQVSGLVRDAATNNPVSGAKVDLLDSANKLYSLNTAANGWYTFTNSITTPISSGAARVTVSKAGYVTKSADLVLVAGQNNRQNFTLDTADLLVSKSDGLTSVVPGQTITYTMVISNVGTIAATSVVITDVLPTYLTYITDTLGIKATRPASLTYVWKLANNIDPGKAVRFRMRVRVADALPSPTTGILNQLSATTLAPEANKSNNTAQDTTTSAGTPNPSITIAVSPNQIRINQNATFTIIVRNAGTAPMTDVVIEDTFSTLLDLTSATTSKGTATRNNTTRLVTVSISSLGPNEEARVTVITRASTNPATNTTVTNSAKLTYKFGGSTFTRTSNSVSLQILVTTTLPGTGGVELAVQSRDARSYLLAFLSAGLLLVLSLVAFVYAYRTRYKQSDWSKWAAKMGMMLAGVAVLFAAAGAVLLNYSTPAARESIAVQNRSEGAPEAAQQETDSEPHNLIWPGYTPQIPGSELDALPDYPIPAPTLSTTPEAQGSDLDLSPINRVIIPAITLDTVVKYVPFDGITWLIAGLKQEVAWMGDTSWPGIGSNTALAGHVTLRDGSDGPFRYLFDLRSGDAVYVYTDQNVYHYRVRDQRSVEETDLTVIEPTDRSQITLITCSEWDVVTGFYTKRYVVHADLVSAKPVERRAQGN